MGPWPNDPLGPQARAAADIYWIMFVAAVIVLVLVDGGLIYAGLRFRDRPGHFAKQFHGHNFLELVWTVVPTIMVISFSVLSFQKLNVMNDTSGAQMTINVTGSQWTWTYEYPREDRFRLKSGKYLVGAEEIHIPVNTKVHLKLSATDVIHSFWVPNIGGKKDAVPGRATDLWVQADRPGTYKGQCYEFCGRGHADMLVTLVAHTEQEFAEWLRTAIADADRADAPETRAGRETFLASACAGCHTVANTTARGKVGPELTHIASKRNIAGVLSPVNEENLKRWIANPPAVKPGTQMPALGMSEQQINDIVQWLLTLK